MKQNGAVAAYQIIQISPLPSPPPGFIQLRRGKRHSGTIFYAGGGGGGRRGQEKGEKKGRKKMHRGKEMNEVRAMAASCPMTSSQPVLKRRFSGR